jgi:glutaredoxin 3
VVFSKTWCPYCKAAKAALNESKADYEVVELDNRSMFAL